jgi:NADPH-dependent 2,4-dienoyl-CoA reductase/sulfur reductase-like enzyme/nitrite reductase/ring-hydroxylating ferredoxin subunit
VSEAAAPSGPDLAAGVPVASVRDGVPLLGHARGEPVILVRRGPDLLAVGAACTHYGGPLAEGLVVEDSIRCPWHHACFDLRTGEATKAPALGDLPCFEVITRDGQARVGDRRPTSRRRLTGHAPSSIVVLGSGAAGAAAVETLRREGYEGPVTLIGAEQPGPVDRPNLSKDYLAGTAPEDWIPLRPASFYDDLGVTLLIGTPATALDTARRRLVLADRRIIEYGALLLATGAEPVRLSLPGAALPHVHVLRDLGHARAIIAAAAGARHAAVIGSSFIGLEVAAALRQRGLDVDVIGRDALPLQPILGEALGRFIKSVHERHGVRFHLAASPRAIRPDQVELDSGETVAADLVVMGVGVRPRTALAEAAGLRVDNGVMVDALMRTSVDGVFAAGDIARYPEARLGELVRIEHWVVAERQGQAAARAMLGVGRPFRDVPFFWSVHYDVTLSYVGHARQWDAVEVRGNIEARRAAVVFRRSGRALAVVTVGRDRLSLEAEAALERGDHEGVDALLRGTDAS